ncbi:MAG: hypothetical protein AAGA06_08045 [Pseudomonadota bacterium]
MTPDDELILKNVIANLRGVEPDAFEIATGIPKGVEPIETRSIGGGMTEPLVPSSSDEAADDVTMRLKVKTDYSELDLLIGKIAEIAEIAEAAIWSVSNAGRRAVEEASACCEPCLPEFSETLKTAEPRKPLLDGISTTRAREIREEGFEEGRRVGLEQGKRELTEREESLNAWVAEAVEEALQAAAEEHARGLAQLEKDFERLNAQAYKRGREAGLKENDPFGKLVEDLNTVNRVIVGLTASLSVLTARAEGQS